MTGVLAIDIGGTKTLAALVDDPTVIDAREAPTPRNLNAERLVRCGFSIGGGLAGQI